MTVFAPTLGAFDNGQDFGSNITLVTEDFANHIINGSVVYSTGFASGNYTSAGGEPFKFASNSSGVYVTVGNSTAKTVQSDIIISKGIDSVLVDTNTNPAAAASAFSSGIAAAQTSTEPTSPVTVTTSLAASGSAPSSTASKGAVHHVATLP
ncbi:hypothetical protein JCM24511_07368 [Saitozyma sp. JCM 24511]|nr:hypothetical protein JCM24511_07368 [Saitozyma sp. JCM 24511]